MEKAQLTLQETSWLMQQLWTLAEQAQARGNSRDCYLLTLAGNLVESTFSSNPIDEALKNAEANADNIANQDSLFLL